MSDTSINLYHSIFFVTDKSTLLLLNTKNQMLTFFITDEW